MGLQLFEILDTQIEFLNDPQIESDILDKINIEHKSAIDAVIMVIAAGAEMLKNSGDEYLSARSADLQDIGSRILKNIDHTDKSIKREFKENSILIAEDLLPSDIITIDLSKVAGFATQLGGRTSHAAIIARTRGIPAIVACGDELMKIEENDIIILDGKTGEVIVNQDTKTIKDYRQKQLKYTENLILLKSIRELKPATTDGHEVNLYANISGCDDLEQVFENGGEGVGLYRTELLFMGRRSFPSEEEQFQVYKQVALSSKNKPVIIRTLDIGGDKQLDYFEIPDESNPFLGYRAIRICLKQKDIFLAQLKDILRAGIYGNLKIMFPMICSIDEVIQAKQCIREAKDELIRSGGQFHDNMQTGIMIEIPSAALMTDLLAKEVDFFSIGTNDLCQYTLAVDRMNSRVSELYNHFNPGVLRLIQNVIIEAHKQNKHVGMCGEMASDPLATLLLLGMGLDEFSMSPASIPCIKNIILKNSLAQAQEVYKNVMKMNNPDSITKYLTELTI